MTKKHSLEGVFAALVTPFNQEYQIDFGLMKQHIDDVIAKGADGVLLIGTTGEASSIGINQKLQIIDYCKNLYHKNQIMFGIGTTSLFDTLTLAKKCLNAGYCNLLSLPPFYYKSVSQELIYSYYAKLIDKINDDKARIYIYNIPAISHIDIEIKTIEKLHAKYPQIVAGVKDSSNKFQQFTKPLLQNTNLTVFSGDDTFLLDNLKAGGPGSITALTNIFPKLPAKIVKTYKTQKDPDETDNLQQILSKYRSFFSGYPIISAIKYILGKRNPNQNWDRIMLPLKNISKQQQKQIDDFIMQTK